MFFYFHLFICDSFNDNLVQHFYEMMLNEDQIDIVTRNKKKRWNRALAGFFA